jgi:hypothetical protein
MEEIENKVALSGLVTLNLEELIDDAPMVLLDIKDQLYMGLMLKEKEFREYIKTHDWHQYNGCNIAITCTSDAIVPTWAYMLIANKLSGIAGNVVFGNLETLQQTLFDGKLKSLDLNLYKDQRVVVKGCSDKPVPVGAYVTITSLLTPLVKTLMFGEPCSTVPIYKRA